MHRLSVRKSAIRKDSYSGSTEPRGRSKEKTFEIADEVLVSLDCPRSLTIHLLLKYGEWDQIANMTIDALNYLRSNDFADAYQATELLRKTDFLDVSNDPKKDAIAGFWKSELDCLRTNRFLLRLRSTGGINSVLPDYCPPLSFASLLQGTALRIASVLGEPRYQEILDNCGFGKGSSSSVRGSATGQYYKASGPLDVTSDLQPHAMWLINAHHPLPSAALNSEGPVSVLASAFTVIRGCEVAFVPKTAKVHRTIAVEPHVNQFLQKGIGEVIARRLRAVGCDIRDQSRNQYLARIGSLHGHLATIDLSAASDTISVELCRELLPPAWFNLLDRVRSHECFIEGSWHRLEKFMTTGNGFTFAVETLIFWALTKEVCVRLGETGAVSVYGDDIICPSGAFDEVCRTLRQCGFLPNPRKSFSGAHPFRESCGEDFFLGIGVRPFYIRTRLQQQEDWFGLHNQITRYALRRNGGLGRDERFMPLIVRMRGKSPYLVPYDLGDVGFATSFEEAAPRRASGGLEGWVAKARIRVPKTHQVVRYYAALYASFGVLGTESPTLGKTQLRRAFVPRTVTIPVREWSATDTFRVFYL